MNKSTYRPDIDGLRAIAVLAVVGFHSFPYWVKGGFIGVDVFFVISGYLISRIIFENLNSDSFSFSDFYARRIGRIFPALILVLVSGFILGWFGLFANEFKQYGLHLVAGASFISNIVLWSEAGYFDNAANTKPLLHLWSLGIEEQFYLLWPLVLWLAWKRRFNLLTITVAVCILSFILNIKGVKQDAVATFYSPQTRFWELLAGSFLAWVTLYRQELFANVKVKIDAVLTPIVYSDQQKTCGETLSNILSFIGLFLLLYGFWRINKDLSYPGTWALIPVIGTLLLLISGTEAWINHTLLSSKISVWFGLISYPLYLWHWLLLSFATIVEGEVPSRYIRISIVFLSIFLAWLTYRFIERPLRSSKQGKLRAVFLAMLMGIAGYIGYNTYDRGGLSFRPIDRNNLINSSMLNWSSDKSIGCEAKLGTKALFCLELGNKDNQTVAVIGDSTGNSISPGLYKEFYENKNEGLVNFGSGTCPPIRGLVSNEIWGGSDTSLAPNCGNVMDHAYSYIINNSNIKTVVLAFFIRDLQYWGMSNIAMDDSAARFDVAKKLINYDVAELTNAGKKVIVIYDIPLYPIDAHSCIRRVGGTSICNVSTSTLIDREPYISLFNNFFKDRPDICVVKSNNVLIVNNRAPLFDKNGVLMIRDNHHLSYNGSNIVAREFQIQGCIVSR